MHEKDKMPRQVVFLQQLTFTSSDRMIAVCCKLHRRYGMIAAGELVYYIIYSPQALVTYHRHDSYTPQYDNPRESWQ